MTDSGPDGRPRTREVILQAVGRAAENLLQATGTSTESALQQALAELGPAAGAGRAYIFVNTTAADGTLTAVQKHSWSAPASPPPPFANARQEHGYEALGLRRWLHTLPRGEAIHGPLAAFPASERATFEGTGLRSLAVVPIFVRDSWWGFVGFSDYRQPRTWSEGELDALRVAAGIIGAAIERRQGERQLRRRNRELDLLNRVVAVATSALEPVPVLEAACRELALAFGIPQAGAALLNPAGTGLEVVAQYSELSGYDAVGAEIPLAGNEATRFVLENKSPLFIADVRRDPRMAAVRQLMEQRQVASILLLPLIVGDAVVGTLGLDAIETYAFSEEDIALAANVAAAAAQVLAQARLLTAEQRNATRLAGILQLSTAIATLRDEHALLDQLVTGVAPIAGSTTATVFLAEDQATEAVLVAQVGLPPASQGHRVPLTHPALQNAIASHEPVLVADIDRQFPELRQYLVNPDLQAFHLYPLRSEGRTLGFLTLGFDTVHRATAAEVSALRLLAERAAAALHTVRLLHAVRQQAEHLGALHELGLAISSSLDPENVYQTIVERAAQLIGTHVVNLFFWEAEREEYVGLATYGAGGDTVRGERYPLHTSKLIPALLDRTAALPLAAVAGSNLVAAGWRRRFNIGALLVVPLRYRDRLIGFLICIHREQSRHWTPEEIALAESLAGQAAIAVANVRLHATTRRLLGQSRAQARTVQQIVDTVPVGLLLLDAAGRVKLANPLARQYLPLLAEVGPDRALCRLGGRPLDRLLAPPPAGKLAHELVVRHPEHHIFELTTHRLLDGPLAGHWILLLNDVSLEREQQAYLQAQDRLATVGQLAAGIAHDFNNIMAVITLYAQALLTRDLPEEDQDRLKVINRQAGQASHLIAQVLDFSRRSVVERRPLNLSPFLKELVKLLQRTLPETIAVRLDLDGSDYSVSADPTRLQQALMNLAVNARDAMPRGGELRFALHRHGPRWQPELPDMEPGEWIRLTVSDSGKGIPREELAHIFEPFFTTKEPGEGTGLGLAQVYGIVKQHDGYIDLTSEPESGTTFSIYLPALSLPPGGTDPEDLEEPVPAAGETILLVEDDEAMRAALARTLADLNYRLVIAANGEEALQHFEADPAQIDLVISDLVMPRMGGEDLYQTLQRHYPGTRMILFSGYPLAGETRQFVEQSGIHWLQKPFSAAAIAEAIAAALNGGY
jgi:signal transduction histidine kinase/ActR/RegA family two-component response regulator